jgi:hypothetical protein
MPPRQIVQRIAKVVVQAIVWSGIAGIVFNSAMLLGLFGSLHWVNYGLGRTRMRFICRMGDMQFCCSL